MKRWLSITLVLVLCLGLCACGKTESVEEAYYGTWCKYYVAEDVTLEDQCCRTLTLYRGGIGSVTVYNLTADKETAYWEFKWDFVDGFVRTTRTITGTAYYDAYGYNAETDTLYEVDFPAEIYVRSLRHDL